MLKLFDRCRFAEVVSTVGLTAAGETIKLGIVAYIGNFCMHSVTAQHAEMTVVISTTPAFSRGFHVHLTIHFLEQTPVKVFPS